MHLIPVLLVTWLHHLVQLQLSLFLCEATVTMLVALFPLTMVSSKHNSSPSSYFKFANFKSLFSSNVKVSSFEKLSSAMLGQVERSRSSSTRFNFALDFCSRFPVTCMTFQIAFFVQQQLLPSDSCPMAIFLNFFFNCNFVQL